MRRIFHATLTAGFLGSTALGAAAVTATLGLGSALMLPRGAEAGPFAPVVYVNNAAVTQYELDQRIRFMQVLRAPGADRESALKALIEDRLKLDAARQIGIAVSDQGLEQGLADFAGRANMDVGQFTEALARDGVDRQAYRDFVKAGVAWRDLSAIGVGTGPGNFTGIRISVAAARGLALSLGVPAVGLDAVSGRAEQLRRGRDQDMEPRVLQGPGEFETGGAGFVDDSQGAMDLGEFGCELADREGIIREPSLDHLSGHAIDRRGDDAAGVNIQSQACSLGEHQGLLCMCALHRSYPTEMIHESA